MKWSTLRPSAAVIAVLFAITAIAPRGFADAWDDAMQKATAARDKAAGGNDATAWHEALTRFQEADAIKPTKDTKFEIGNAAAQLSQDDVAVEAYQAALDLGLAGKAKDKAKAFLKLHASKMARLEVHGPAGAQVTIAGQARGKLPHEPFVVFAGMPITVHVEQAGRSVDEEVQLGEGVAQTIDVMAKLDAPPAPSASASTSASAGPKLPDPGSQTVPLSDTGAGARALGWSLIAIGGGVFVGSGVTVVVASASISSRRDSLASHCVVLHNPPDTCATAKPGEQDAAQSDADALKTWHGVQTAGLVAGGVGLAIAGVGVVRLLTAPEPPRASAWMPHVEIGRGVAVFGIRGSL